MDARSLVVSTGFEPSSKTAELRNASSGSAHKKKPALGGLHGFLVDDNLLAVQVDCQPNHLVLQ